MTDETETNLPERGTVEGPGDFRVTTRACMWVITERGVSCPFEATYLLTEQDRETADRRPYLHTHAAVRAAGDLEESPAEFPVCRVHLEPMVDHLLVGMPRQGRRLPLTLEVL